MLLLLLLPYHDLLLAELLLSELLSLHPQLSLDLLPLVFFKLEKHVTDLAMLLVLLVLLLQELVVPLGQLLL